MQSKQIGASGRCYRGLVIVLAVISMVFIVFEWNIFPVVFDNLGGIHSWLSGSTIKFVNNWLAEGPMALNFTNYELPLSVEHAALSSREVYISYPTGETMLVYLAARLSGQTYIGIEFLKHVQLLLYWLETMLFASFVYIWLGDMVRMTENSRRVASVLLITLWLALPTNVWYMGNVFFSDQCVILWVFAFLLLDYLISWNKRINIKYLYILQAIVIFAGILTDYYFWVLLFVTVVFRCGRSICLKRSFQEILCEAGWYFLPALMAVSVFLAQLLCTPNWRELLLAKYLFRTGQTEYLTSHKMLGMLRDNLAAGLFDIKSSAVLIGLVLIFLLVAFVVYGIKNHALKRLLCDYRITILFIGLVAPILQIILLKNHSAIHEFSMIKMGWPLVMSVPAMAVFMQRYCTWRYNKEYGVFALFGVCFLFMLYLTAIPGSSQRFYRSHNKYEVYPIENVLHKELGYYDVCASYTYEIPSNPPQALSVSGKSVYKISDLADIERMFPNLDPQARIVLLIDKRQADKNADVQESENQETGMGEILYEDENCRLVAVGRRG